MEKHSILFYIILVFVLLLCLRIYYDSDAYNLKCIIASQEGNRYCVREREKLELAANENRALFSQYCRKFILKKITPKILRPFFESRNK